MVGSWWIVVAGENLDDRFHNVEYIQYTYSTNLFKGKTTQTHTRIDMMKVDTLCIRVFVKLCTDI